MTIRLAVLLAFMLALTFARAQEAPQVAPQTTTAPVVQTAPAQPVVARQGMVSSQESRATRVGVDILQRGGNAVDAAVAVGFALAVTHPHAGNLGGGGFMLVHLAERNETVSIDYRETAPQAVTPTTFLDDKGEADPVKSRDSALAVGVPGTVAGLALAHERLGSGKFTLADLIAPALTLARNGFMVEDDLADVLSRAQEKFARWPSSRIFRRSDGTVLAPGDLLVQADLAASLDLIARMGPRAFYGGPIGEKIVAALQSAGGIMTLQDLSRYQATMREPVHGTYRGYDIRSMAPPSSGGTLLVEMLNVLERFMLADLRPDLRAHLMIETMKLAYADRAAFLGDPGGVDMPIEKLTSKPYAFGLAMGIDYERARPALEIREAPREGSNTTHFSVIDRHGNAVANTTTLNLNFGVGMVAEGTGILLNNELDDFAVKAGVPNFFGLVGGSANAPGPGKRPLSSMTPTIVLKDGKVFLVTGSPGGSRIITTALQVIVNAIDHRMNIAEAVAAPRLHHQWLPDEVLTEPAIPADLTQGLQRRGHKVVERPPWSSANSIMVTPDGLAGAADQRTRGSLAAGY